MHKIEIYEDKYGNSEILEYLRELKNSNNKDNRVKLKKINMYVKLLSEYGLTLTEPYLKHIDKEIWELRPLRNRILFASWCDNKFVLLSIFMKQTAKTPIQEIIKAKKYLEDYKKRSV